MRTLAVPTGRHAIIWLAPRLNVGRFLLGLLVIASSARAQDRAEERTSNAQGSTFNVQPGEQSDSLSLPDLARWNLTLARVAGAIPLAAHAV